MVRELDAYSLESLHSNQPLPPPLPPPLHLGLALPSSSESKHLSQELDMTKDDERSGRVAINGGVSGPGSGVAFVRGGRRELRSLGERKSREVGVEEGGVDRGEEGEEGVDCKEGRREGRRRGELVRERKRVREGWDGRMVGDAYMRSREAELKLIDGR